MKNKANGILAAILAAVMCLTLLSSCSGGGEGKESESTGGDHGTTTGDTDMLNRKTAFSASISAFRLSTEESSIPAGSPISLR